jgi:N-acetylglucosaminyldiphosphoundecaprenol N-acetyl-beta-D-mannosaminyltransferase
VANHLKLSELRPVRVWGLPLAPVTFDQTLALVDALIAEGKPRYFITANLHYAMLTAGDPRLPPVNGRAAFVLADGMPLVWASRWREAQLPERVAGSDLVPALCARAAERGYRVFFLGGAPGIGDEAARRMRERFPAIQIVGVEAPPYRALSAEEEAQLRERIRAARPHLLFVAFGQPKGELWLAEHGESLGVPAAVQIGASLDFLAGKVQRSPRWIQRLGFEWAYRLSREPLRLASRYGRNGLFALRMLARDALSSRGRRQ